MGDAVKVFLLTLSALFPIVDPLAGSPLFLAMTQDYSPETRKALAWRVSLYSLVLMVGSYFVGAHVLTFFASRSRLYRLERSDSCSDGLGCAAGKNESHETARRNVKCSSDFARFLLFRDSQGVAGSH